MRWIARLLRDERGVTAVEYGLILMLIVIGLVTALQGIGDQLVTSFNTTSSGLASS